MGVDTGSLNPHYRLDSYPTVYAGPHSEPGKFKVQCINKFNLSFSSSWLYSGRILYFKIILKNKVDFLIDILGA